MLDVAIFGGAFDPIGLHHEKIAEQIDMETWIMPCFQHRFNKNLASPEHRLNMVTLISQKIVPFDWEIKNQHNGSMFETLSRLKQEFTNHRFHVVIGMDNANEIGKWDRGILLIEQYPFLVIERPGIEQKASWFLERPHRIITQTCSSSSTQIRNAIKNNQEFAKQHLNPKVWDYILANKLYGVR